MLRIKEHAIFDKLTDLLLPALKGAMGNNCTLLSVRILSRGGGRKVQMQLCHFLTRFATAIQRGATSDGAHQPLAPIRNVMHPAWRPGAPLCLRTPGWIVWIVKLFNDPVRRAAQTLFFNSQDAQLDRLDR